VDAFVREVKHALAGLWFHNSTLESASRLWFGNGHTACISEASRVGLNCGIVNGGVRHGGLDGWTGYLNH